MTYLLDTHAMIWAVTEPEKLSEKVRRVLEDPTNEIVISTISFWEISIKYALDKLDLDVFTPQDFPKACREMRFSITEFSAEDAASYHQLASTYHKDPFDRMLIWQAIQNRYTLISNDDQIKKYVVEGLKVMW